MNRLKELRENKKKTQIEMAALVNVAQQTWSSWESGRTTPQAHQMQFLEDYFEIAKENIFFNDFNYKTKLMKNGTTKRPA